MKVCAVCGLQLSKAAKSELCRVHSLDARKQPCAVEGCETRVVARSDDSLCRVHAPLRRKARRAGIPSPIERASTPGCWDCGGPVDRPAAVRCDSCVELRHLARLKAAA